MPEICAPRRALVGEDVRLVEMKVVNHVGIAQGLDENQVIIVRPARPGGDDGVLRSGFANRRSQLRLHAIPAVRIGKFRFV